MHHCWKAEKMFHSRLSKMALKVVFYLFIFLKHQVYIFYQKTFYEKRTLWKNCQKISWKYSWLNYAEFSRHTEVDRVCLYENSARQTFTLTEFEIWCKFTSLSCTKTHQNHFMIVFSDAWWRFVKLLSSNDNFDNNLLFQFWKFALIFISSDKQKVLEISC